MIRKPYLLFLLCISAASLQAQNLENVQVHGFVSEGVLYSSHNNYLEKNTSNGDPGWTEAVVSITDTPVPKLRVGLQLHYFRLGDQGGPYPTIDWALGDYKVNNYFGIRAGKVKTPIGLFNDSQDIDAVHLWSLLPQATYPIDNRTFFLSHLGGEVYGTAALGSNGGKLSYRAYGGENELSRNGGYIEQIQASTGLIFSDSPSGPLYGGDLRWQTPYKPLLVGTSLFVQHQLGVAPTGSVSLHVVLPVYYAQFDNGKFYVAGEFRRQPAHAIYQIGPFTQNLPDDQRQWYVMTAYHATAKLQLGTYYSHFIDASLPKFQQTSSSKDLVFSARYDFNANFYAKAENHFLHGTALGFYADDNPGGLTSRTDLVIGKIGFYF